MDLHAESAMLRAAGRAWFATWSVQIVVSLIWWTRPFSLPARYYEPFHAPFGRRLPHLANVDRFQRLAHAIHPFHVTRRSPGDLATVVSAAETTHIVTFGIVSVLSVALGARGATGTGVFLVVWNVLFNLYPVAVQRRIRARLRRRLLPRCHAPDALE
jgi:hypothetical protein